MKKLLISQNKQNLIVTLAIGEYVGRKELKKQNLFSANTCS